MSKLPEEPFDGMIFVDSYKIKWVFDGETQLWARIGKVDTIPLADSKTIGLLDKRYKTLIDRIPNKGGGYAIITKPTFDFKNKDNPDGLIYGDVILKSESLNIKCVFSDGREIKPECGRVVFLETDKQPPGFDINFSSKLLNTLCLEVPGGPGLPGKKGPEGPPGKDGYGDGPKGLKGESGKDALEHHRIVGTKIIEVDNIFDTAIVRLELDAPNGKLYVTKGRMNIPTDENTAVSKLIATQIDRDIRFSGNCFDYEIVVGPCRTDDDFMEPNPTIAYYPSHFNPGKLVDASGKRRNFQLVRRKFRDLVSNIIDYYQQKLDEAADMYDDQIIEFMKSKDASAREKLDVLGDELAKCEHITYLEYCLAPTDCRPVDNKVVDLPQERPECQAVITATGCISGKCQILSSPVISAKVSPVFSFKAPPMQLPAGVKASSAPKPNTSIIRVCPDGCEYIYEGSIVTIPPGGVLPPNVKLVGSPRIETRTVCLDNDGNEIPCEGQQSSIPVKDWEKALAEGLSAGRVVYAKNQLKSGNNTEFPPSIYAFVYVSGAFRQNKSPAWPPDIDQGQAVNGAFQEYWVGNEGEGRVITGPYFIYNGEKQASFRAGWRGGKQPDPSKIGVNFSAPILHTCIGLQVGWAPKSYVNKISQDFFTKFAWGPVNESGNNVLELPNPRIDFEASVGADVIVEEDKIEWKDFPVIGQASDLNQIQQAYLSGPLESRMVYFKTTEPGFFFTRVKTAFGVVNYSGKIPMPPVVKFNLRPSSVNIAWLGFLEYISENPGIHTPFVNCWPVADGSVQLQMIKVDCTDSQDVPEIGGTNLV